MIKMVFQNNWERMAYVIDVLKPLFIFKGAKSVMCSLPYII